MALTSFQLQIPADVPSFVEQEYNKNIMTITKQTGKLMLFACDQKIEHLNKDFYGSGIHADALSPEHLFTIAHQGTVGAFASHLGLIARYGKRYPHLNYIIKLNGKTDLITTQQQDPLSMQLWNVHDVITFKKSSGLNICGIGYTIYLGSEYEQTMLAQAAQVIYEAHQYGLVAIIWIYPRGKAITDDQDGQLVAGATGIANALGADFVKIKAPYSMQDLAIATTAAGNTKVICSGGATTQPEHFLRELYSQIHEGKAFGCATGRNIFQKSLPQAIAFTHAIAGIVFNNVTVDEAMKLYLQSK